ncbi:MAG: 2-oxoacid:acceptor oxidoreductase subunit alpha, partial [Zestosphaera sp.]
SRLISKILSSFSPERVIDVENNIGGQAAKVIAMNTGYTIRKYILKWTGRPIYLMELIDGIKRILSEREDRVVLSYGK